MRPRKYGYTLIELLVVLFILGLVTSFVVVNYRGFNQNLQPGAAARRFSFLLQHAKTYAIVTGHTLKIEFNTHDYRFRSWRNQIHRTWQTIQNDKLLHRNYKEPTCKITLKMNQHVSHALHVLDSGYVAPFEITFKQNNSQRSLRLDASGQLHYVE